MMCEDQIEKTKRCGKYTLRLIGKMKTYFKGTVEIDFKPIQKTKKIQKMRILPTFNNDRKYFTPAFTVPSFPLESDQQLKEQHERRQRENTTQISQILIPKPRSRQKYCGVCREYYEEYLTHVSTEKHIQKLRNSPFQGYIIQTCRKLKQDNTERQPEFQKLNNAEFSCETIFPSTEEDMVDACLNLQ